MLNMTVACFCLAAVAEARVWHVPDDVATLAAAMDSSVAGDTVLVGPGTYYAQHLELTDGIVLTSEYGPLETLISGVPNYLDHGGLYCIGLSEYTEISGFHLAYFSPGLVGDGTATIWIDGSRDVCLRNNIIGMSDCCQWALHVTGFQGRLVIENCTFYMGGIEFEQMCCFDDPLPETVFRNNIVWGWFYLSEWLIFPDFGCNDYLNSSDIPSFDENSFSKDPLFCTDLAIPQRYGLHGDSPCLPDSTGCGLVGAIGVQCGATPIKKSTWGHLKNKYGKD